jgi:hypothetical protein
MIWLLFFSLPCAFAAEEPKLTAENLKMLDLGRPHSAFKYSRNSAFKEVKSSRSSSHETVPKFAQPTETCDYFYEYEDKIQEAETVVNVFSGGSETDCNQETFDLAFNEKYSEDLADSFLRYYTDHMHQINAILIVFILGNLLIKMIQK